MKDKLKTETMKIIKIDTSTIRKNPNAGNTMTRIPGKVSVDFEIEGNIPDFINKSPFIIIEWKMENNVVNYARGYIEGAVEQIWVDSTPNLKINIHKEVRDLNHAPEPDYFYDFEDTYLTCNQCKNEIEVDEIEEDWVNDEYEVKICPKCGAENSFPEYRFQKLSELE